MTTLGHYRLLLNGHRGKTHLFDDDGKSLCGRVTLGLERDWPLAMFDDGDPQSCPSCMRRREAGA